MLSLSHLTAKLGALTGPYQLFMMLVLLAVFLYGVSVGKTRALLSLLAIYVAFMLTVLFPYMNGLKNMIPNEAAGALVPAAFFFIFYVAVLITLQSSSLKTRVSLGELSIHKVIIISLIQVGFLGSILVYLLPEGSLPAAVHPVYGLLGTQRALFVWSLIAVGMLPFMKQKRD